MAGIYLLLTMFNLLILLLNIYVDGALLSRYTAVQQALLLFKTNNSVCFNYWRLDL